MPALPPPPPPRAHLPARRSSWGDASDSTTVPDPPRRLRGMRPIDSKVDTLVGFAVGRRIEPPVTLLTGSASSKAPSRDATSLGPSPFGPATAEFDLSPYLWRLPVEVPRRLLVLALMVCFMAGSVIAIATATDGSNMRVLKWSTAPGPSSLAQAALER